MRVITETALTPQPLLFWKKRETPKKTRVFLFAETLESLQKEGKTDKKIRAETKKTIKINKDSRVRGIVPLFSA